MSEELAKPSADAAGRPAGSKPVRVLPDRAICRAHLSGIGDLVFCLVSDAQSCPYNERHAFNNFCFHPESEAIIARTAAKRS